MIEEYLLEIANHNLDENSNVSISLLGSKWLHGIKILSLKNDCVKYTYYELEKISKKKRLVERITPLDMIEEIKISLDTDKSFNDLEKDLQLEYVENIENSD